MWPLRSSAALLWLETQDVLASRLCPSRVFGRWPRRFLTGLQGGRHGPAAHPGGANSNLHSIYSGHEEFQCSELKGPCKSKKRDKICRSSGKNGAQTKLHSAREESEPGLALPA